MDVALEKCIDLAEYGGEGELIMGPQTLKSRAVLKNEISKRTIRIIRDADGKTSTETMPLDAGDMEILQILSYVRKAPFSPMIDSFFQYCDKLEAVKPGASIMLGDRMQSVVEEIIDSPSPLDR